MQLINGWEPAVYMVICIQTFVCFTYRIYLFQTFDLFCSCIRGHHIIATLDGLSPTSAELLLRPPPLVTICPAAGAR